MIERRRINRVSSDFRVSINLCNTDTNTPFGTPVHGRIIDFTPNGACLYLDRIQCGSHHIFNTTQDHDNHVVSLVYATDEDDGDNVLEIFGNPAWYVLASSDVESEKFKMGIEFLTDQNEENLQKFLAKLADHTHEEEGWLSKMFKNL